MRRVNRKQMSLLRLEPLIESAVGHLRKYEELTEGKGYYLAFSGGKDSVVIKALADMAGVNYDAHYNITGIDPPEVIRFIREHHPDVSNDKPPKGTFLQLLPTKGFPIRHGKWCCEKLKECHGEGRVVVTGVRKAESPRRMKQAKLLTCDTINYRLSPIIDWTDEDVWRFIRKFNLPYCKLYDEGWHRIGCMFCPSSTILNKRQCYDSYPKVVEAFKRKFRKLYSLRKSQGNPSVDRWKDGDEMFEWWLWGDK